MKEKRKRKDWRMAYLKWWCTKGMARSAADNHVWAVCVDVDLKDRLRNIGIKLGMKNR